MLRRGRTQVPDGALIANDLAWRLATSGDDKLRSAQEAVELATQANTLAGGRNVQILDTLAAAYAEAGRFAEARDTARQAIELAERHQESML